jgi:hypothetical protein
MRSEQIDKLKALEGRHVSLALRDGSRIDDCQLVSVGRGAVRSVWIFAKPLDVFLPLDNLIDVWETRPARVRWAA